MIEIKNSSYTGKYEAHIPCSFAYNVVCIDDRFSKLVVLYRGKNAVNKFVEAILKEYDYYRKIIKKHLNKNLVMCAKDEERFQSSNKYWIYNKVFNVGDNDHIAGKYRGSAHWNCNINRKLTKKVPLIFHNLRGYNNHLFNH